MTVSLVDRRSGKIVALIPRRFHEIPVNSVCRHTSGGNHFSLYVCVCRCQGWRGYFDPARSRLHESRGGARLAGIYVLLRGRRRRTAKWSRYVSRQGKYCEDHGLSRRQKQPSDLDPGFRRYGRLWRLRLYVRNFRISFQRQRRQVHGRVRQVRQHLEEAERRQLESRDGYGEFFACPKTLKRRVRKERPRRKSLSLRTLRKFSAHSAF